MIRFPLPVLVALVATCCCVTSPSQTVTTGKAVKFGITPPVRELPPAEKNKGSPKRLVVPIGHLTNRVASAAVISMGPLTAEEVDPVVQSAQPVPLVPAPSLTFEGISVDANDPLFGTLFVPPDTNGDVGPNHYVQMVNGGIFRVYDKESGAPLTDPIALNSLFEALGGPCADTSDGDPVVLYDPLADRWLLSQLANVFSGPPFFESIAISQTPDPTGSYFVYCFQMPNDKFNDYPKFGVWPDAYYMTDNQFSGVEPDEEEDPNSDLGAGVFAFDRAKMVAGVSSASFVYFDLADIDATIGGVLPADLDGTPPPTNSPDYFVFFESTEAGNPQDALRIFEFHVDFTAPTNSTFTERTESPLSVAAFNPNLTGITQPASDGTTLDTLSDRLMHRLQYRNFGDHESLVVNHTVNVGNNHAGVRYYELRRDLPDGEFLVNEQATFAPDTDNRWMGSAAMDHVGNLAVGYSVSGPSLFPSIRYAARLVTDPPGGLFQGETTLFAGSGSQTDGIDRWGDYSMLAVDPVDDCTFWYTTEYLPSDGSFNWHTRIGKFSLANCSSVPLVNLAFDSAIISGGNGNGFIDLDECNLLTVTIGNLGTNTITGIIAALTSATPGVTITQAASTYADLAGGATGTNDIAFEFCVSSNVVCGSAIDFSMALTNDVGPVAHISFTLNVGITTNLFSVDFESGLNGITTNNNGNGLWHLSGGRGQQPGHSKTNSLYFGQGETVDGGGTYDIGAPVHGTFTLPPINLVGAPGHVALTFNHFLQRESSAPGAFDVAKVELSHDGGRSFVTVGGPFTTTLSDSAPRHPVFRQANVDLTPFANQQVILRFSFDSIDQVANHFEGWYVDDIAIKAFSCAGNAASNASQVVSQGTSPIDGTGLFSVFDAVQGTELLTQPVLTNGLHVDFRSFPVDTAGNGIEAVTVTGVGQTGRVDFEVRNGRSGDLITMGELPAFIGAPYAATNGDIAATASEEVIFVGSGAAGTALDVLDSTTASPLPGYPTGVLDVGAYTNLSLVIADVDGNGKKDVIVLGQRLSDSRVMGDVRIGETGRRIGAFTFKSIAPPLQPFAADLTGEGQEQLVILGASRKGAALAIVNEFDRKPREKKVLKSASNNAVAFAARVLPGTGKQIVAIGVTGDGRLAMEIYSSKGKRLRKFDLSAQVQAPLRAFAADINGDGRDEVLLSAVRTTNGKPVLIALDPNTGGSLYVADLFESEDVSNVRVFAADVDGDGVSDVVASATRDSDSKVLFEARAGVSGILFNPGFSAGTDFVGPNAAFGIHTGD